MRLLRLLPILIVLLFLTACTFGGITVSPTAPSRNPVTEGTENTSDATAPAKPTENTVTPETTAPPVTAAPTVPETTAPPATAAPTVPETTAPPATAAPTVPETTAPPATTAPTVPETTAPPATTAPTVPETTAPPATTAPTQPQPTQTEPAPTQPTAPPVTEPTDSTEPAGTSARHDPQKPSDYCVSQREQALLDQIHAMRSKKQLPMLTADKLLGGLAYLRASEIPARFSHVRPDGENYAAVFSEFSYAVTASGETILKCEDWYTAEYILEDWLFTKTTADTMTDPKFTHVGVGIYEQNGYIYVVCLLAAL